MKMKYSWSLPASVSLERKGTDLSQQISVALCGDAVAHLSLRIADRPLPRYVLEINNRGEYVPISLPDHCGPAGSDTSQAGAGGN